MSTTNTQSPEISYLQGKDTEFKAQLQKVFHSFLVKPMTMKEADVYTGVMRENICRYVNTLLEQGKIKAIRKRKCTITGHPKVNEYTANPELFPIDNQLKLF
jgi:hypothetical protein